MAYKPLVQTVTNGATRDISSSDAVFDAIAAAVPASVAGDVNKVIAIDATGLKTLQYAGLGGGGLPTDSVILGRSKPTNVTGTNNVLIGPSTVGNALTTGADNILVGTSAGALMQAQTRAIVIGTQAFDAISTGAIDPGSVAIGYQALTAVTSSPTGGFGSGGGSHVAVGYLAGTSLTTGRASVFIGDSAGQGISTTGQTVAVGAYAASNSTLDQSIAIGYGAGRSSAGLYSTFVGHSANGVASSSNRNIALGYAALAASNEFGVGSSTAQINTMLLGRGGASQTVANAVTLMTMRASGTTDTSMTLGALTLGGSQGTGTGAGGDVIIATAPAAGVSGSTTNAHVERIRAKSATEVVVNDTGVDFDFRVEGDADANLLFVDAGTDRVGVGLNNPSVKFEVSGDSSLNGALVVNEAGADKDTRIEGDADANLVFVDASTDKVGIGTNTPAEKLEVNGSIQATSGDVKIATAGKGLSIKEGTDAKIGVTGAFPGGGTNTVTVSTTAVTANSIIFISAVSGATTIDPKVWVSNITAGTSFVISSGDNSFVGTVGWMIVERIP